MELEEKSWGAQVRSCAHRYRYVMLHARDHLVQTQAHRLHVYMLNMCHACACPEAHLSTSVLACRSVGTHLYPAIQGCQLCIRCKRDKNEEDTVSASLPPKGLTFLSGVGVC